MSENARLLKRWIRLVIMGIVIVSAALLAKKLMTKRVDAKPLEPVNVVVRAVERKIVAEYLSFTGKVEPIHDVVVSAETGGRFLDMPVDVGSRVKAGDVLVRIDDSLQKSAMLRAEAEHADAGRELERARKLSGKGAVSRSVLEAAEKRMQFAEAGLQDAKTRLAKCVLRSPINGRIEERYVETGEYAKDGNPVFRIADISTAKVVVYIPEGDICDVKEGDTMEFRVSAVPDKTFKGKVTFVARSGDVMNHAFRVEMRVDNPAGSLRGGMIADVVLSRSTSEPVIEIPFTAVLPRGGNHIVFVWENGRAIRKTVRIHSLAKTHALISSGLSEGEMLIIEGQRFLQDGKRVLARRPAQER